MKTLLHHPVLAALSAVFCACAFAGASAATITSVAQVRALNEDDYDLRQPFCITGQVTTVFGKLCALDAPDGCCVIWSNSGLWKDWSVEDGSVVCASGYTELDSFANDPVLNTTNVVVLGRRPLPETKQLSAADILSGVGDYRRVRVRGFLTDVFNDDIDDNYVMALLNVDGQIIRCFTDKGEDTLRRLVSLLDADVEITGICTPVTGGKRHYGGPGICLKSVSEGIRVLVPPNPDPFAAPPLADFGRTRAERIAALKRHSVHGRVLAAWRHRSVLLAYGKGRISRLTLASGERLPHAGDWIDAVGFPETDLFTVNLSNVRIRPAPAEPSVPEEPAAVSADRICHHPFTRRFDHDFHGRLVRIQGVIRAVTRQPDAPEVITIESDGVLLPVDSGSTPGAFDDAEIGSKVEATGICVMESENWRPQHVLPTISSVKLVLRSPADLRILSRPPWWTPRRFLSALAWLALVIIGILVWNAALRRRVEKRSRELLRAQTARIETEMRLDERTNIAAELHDYLAQNLTTLAYKLTEARAANASDPGAANAKLATAAAMLDSSRTELRRCLWDLRSKALEEPTFDLAIRRSLQQITSFDNIEIDFDVPRSRVSDPTAHAILSAIRELVANAVNHGFADHIVIHGEISSAELTVSVTDNGCGFDVAAVRDSEGGHFGLDGIRQRVKRLNGAFTITSAHGKGTSAVIKIKRPNQLTS